MKRVVVIILLAAVLVVLSAATIYLVNPSGTASYDPRGRVFGYIPYRFPSSSMLPTLERGDFLVVSTYAYASAGPERGDIITFLYPKDPSIVYAKRVAGLAGDSIVISNGILFVNGKIVNEPYIDTAQLKKPFSLQMNQVTVPEGSLFVLGDNRDNSNDSRFWGFVPRDFVIGKVVTH